jgi:hypothetical protein
MDKALAPDWGPLFVAAGLDAKDFRATPPQWTPLVTSDVREAWMGTWPGHPDLPLRVEAAAFRGKVVFFDLYSSWDKADRMQEERRTTGEKISSGIALGIFALVIALGITLARSNVRAGRSDWKGAAKLALFCFAVMMAAMIFFAHHVPTTAEVELLMMMAGWSLVGTSLVWLMYVALEPHVRKRWPTSLVSWSRLLAGEILDPVVGRDVLVGVLTGVFWATISRVGNLVPGWTGKTPLEPANSLDFIIMGGIHYTIGDILLNVMIYLFGSLVLFFIFFLMRLVLRKEWLAIAVTVVLLSIQSAFTDHAILNVTENVVVVGIALLLLVRFGLLALLIAFSLNNVLQAYPLTGHFSEWYAQPTIVVFMLISALAIFGFYTSTAGKSRLGSISLDG